MQSKTRFEGTQVPERNSKVLKKVLQGPAIRDAVGFVRTSFLEAETKIKWA